MTRPKPAATRQGHSSSVPEFRPNHEPVPAPPAPASLGKVGQKLWCQLWWAGRNAYQPETDSAILERYCSLSERRQELLTLLASEGYVTTGSQGQPVTHPGAKILDSIEGRLGPIEDRLGLNPEARFRLGISSVEQQSKLARFLEKGGD